MAGTPILGHFLCLISLYLQNYAVVGIYKINFDCSENNLHYTIIIIYLIMAVALVIARTRFSVLLVVLAVPYKQSLLFEPSSIWMVSRPPNARANRQSRENISR